MRLFVLVGNFCGCGTAFDDFNGVGDHLENLAARALFVGIFASSKLTAHRNLAALVTIVVNVLCVLVPKHKRDKVGCVLGEWPLDCKVDRYNGLTYGGLLELRFLADVSGKVNSVHYFSSSISV